MTLEWKEIEVGSGKKLYLGKYHVGSVFWDGFTSQTEDRKYKVACKLPGIKPDLGRYKTVDEGKARLIQAVNTWILGAMGEI